MDGKAKIEILILLALASTVMAGAQNVKVDGINYRVLSESDRTAEVISNKYIGDDVVISPQVTIDNKTYTVVSIGDHAFHSCSNIKSISIPATVKTIGNGAFIFCRELSNVDFPSSVTTIGNYAFEDCSSFTELELPSSLTSIGFDAFQWCKGLTTVTIPATVSEIGEGAFGGCKNLTNILVSAENPEFKSVEGVLFDKSENILYQYPAGKKGSYSIPGSVTEIKASAFFECINMDKVEIPTTVSTIGSYAFYGCHLLTKVVIPESIETLSRGMFYYCSNLNNVEMSNSVTKISASAFYDCDKLINVVIPNSVKIIEESAFFDCNNLEHVTLGSSVEVIEGLAFDRCYCLTDVTCLSMIPPSLEFRAFTDITYRECELNVPSECRDSYKEANGWNNFNKIVGNASGIEDMVADGNVDVDIYNLSGIQVYKGRRDGINLPAGIYLERSGSHTRKIAIR